LARSTGIATPSSGLLDGVLPVDLAANGESLDPTVLQESTVDEFKAAIRQAKANPAATAVHVETEPSARIHPVRHGGTCW
jgi:3D-(3,5/4)-trihydroxycyclohexane-1,2-dione acylhydrolase (decyclizing)